MPKLLEVKEVTETKNCQATVCRTCILAVQMTIKVGQTKRGNQTERLKYSKRTISCQFRADAPTYCHQPQYKADNDEAEIVPYDQKRQISAWCLLLL